MVRIKNSNSDTCIGGGNATLTYIIELRNGRAVQKTSGTSSSMGQTINISETTVDLGEYYVKDNKFYLRGSEMGTFEDGKLTYLGMIYTK